MKYAFIDKDSGKLNISLKHIGPDTYRLIISDNGVGLPERFESKKNESLGMYLMAGLTDQLEGTFELENNNGLTITVIFTNKKQLVPDENVKVTLEKIEKNINR